MKRSGPRREPCGAPQESGRGCEVWLEALTENDLEVRYDLNQSRAVPEMPNQEESRRRRRLWSIVSNAAEMLETRRLSTVVVSVLPLGRFLASIILFSTLSCFLPFSLVPHTTTLSETRSAYPIVSFPLVFFSVIRPFITSLRSTVILQ